MAKKRQQDFIKTQLKPGRTLTRRKNATPAVKAKKITMPKKCDGSPKTIPTVLTALNSQKSGSVSHKITSLQHLEDLIDGEQVTFHISEIFETVAKLILELDANLRNAAIKVLKKIFEKKYSGKLKAKILSLSPLLINVLKCGMTSTVYRVKGSTLLLLNIILENYPDLICNSTVILQSFHPLLFVPVRKLHQQQSAKLSSAVPILHDSQINNENYKIQVFDTLELFFKKMLKNFETNVAEEGSDEQEIYWNCEGPLHLEIYAGSGLKPIDIEKSAVDNFNSQMLNFDDSLFNDFIIPIISTICQAFVEEIPRHVKNDENIQNKSSQNVNVLLQLLCQITELVELVPYEEVDQEIRTFVLDVIYKRGLFPYPSSALYSQNQLEVTKFNLAVCFLHSRFILQTNYCKDEHNEAVMKCIKNVLQQNNDLKSNSIPMVVKILKVYYSLTHLSEISDFISRTLSDMSSLFKKTPGRGKKLPNTKAMNVLISLFTKLSLYPAYDFLIESEAMQNWFDWLLNQLVSNTKARIVNKNLLQVTKIIANRKYPSFYKALSKAINDGNLKTLLEYDNSDVRDAVIFLIYNMENISGSLFENISNVILLQSSFPTQYAVRLIRLLTSRFTEKPPIGDIDFDLSAFRRGRVDFIQFLLNVAVDSLNMTSKKWFDYEANEYTKALEVFKDAVTFNIFPSLHWKKHSKLFDVCQKSLSLLPQKLVSSIATFMLKEALTRTRNLPIHSTIAIMKLNNWEINDIFLHFQLHELMFSCVFTISVLSQILTEDEWYKYNVIELMDSLNLTRRMVVETLQEHVRNVAEINGITLYHILRMCKFYLDRRLLKPEDGDRVISLLDDLKAKCSDKTIEQQPLYIQLSNIFFFYA